MDEPNNKPVWKRLWEPLDREMLYLCFFLFAGILVMPVVDDDKVAVCAFISGVCFGLATMILHHRMTRGGARNE